MRISDWSSDVCSSDLLISVKDFRSRAQVRVIVERCLYSGFIAITIELKAFMTMPGQRHASDHDAHAFITAHRVCCDSRPCPLFRQLLVPPAANLHPDSIDFCTVVMSVGHTKICVPLSFPQVPPFRT